MGLLKKLIRKFVFSVPHLSLAFDKRQYTRHKPDAKISAKMKIGGETITCKVLDISIGGLKIATVDGRVTDARNILLEAGEFRISVPCAEIRGKGPVYSVIFDELAEARLAVLDHIIATFTKKPPVIGPEHIFR